MCIKGQKILRNQFSPKCGTVMVLMHHVRYRSMNESGSFPHAPWRRPLSIKIHPFSSPTVTPQPETSCPPDITRLPSCPWSQVKETFIKAKDADQVKTVDHLEASRMRKPSVALPKKQKKDFRFKIRRSDEGRPRSFAQPLFYIATLIKVLYRSHLR